MHECAGWHKLSQGILFLYLLKSVDVGKVSTYTELTCEFDCICVVVVIIALGSCLLHIERQTMPPPHQSKNVAY